MIQFDSFQATAFIEGDLFVYGGEFVSIFLVYTDIPSLYFVLSIVYYWKNCTNKKTWEITLNYKLNIFTFE